LDPRHQIEQLKIALDSNRIIGAVVGVLMGNRLTC